MASKWHNYSEEEVLRLMAGPEDLEPISEAELMAIEAAEQARTKIYNEEQKLKGSTTKR